MNISLSTFGSCLRIRSRETGSTVPSRVSLLISILRLNLVLIYEIPSEFRGGVINIKYEMLKYEMLNIKYSGTKNAMNSGVPSTI